MYWHGNTSTSTPLFNATGGSGGEGFTAWQDAGKDPGSVLADPQFDSTSAFTLKPSSPAFHLGFQPIDISKVGPVQARVGCLADVALPTGVGRDPHIVQLAGAGLVR